jgi:hypothetical protein
MRTKLLLSAAIGVLASAAAFGQGAVYSVNAVGFINVTVPGVKLALVANQLNSTSNTVSNLFAGVPDGTLVYEWTGTGFFVNEFAFGGWTAGGNTVDPGEGVFVRNPTATDLKITFVGEVPQGTLTTPITSGLNLVSSKVPQAGTLQTALQYPAADGDFIFKWNVANQAYDTFEFAFGTWSPAQPEIGVGESFFARAANGATWTRTFSVNN